MSGWYVGDLPTVEEIRVEMLRILGDAVDMLLCDRLDVPTDRQAFALGQVLGYISHARVALDQVGK